MTHHILCIEHSLNLDGLTGEPIEMQRTSIMDHPEGNRTYQELTLRADVGNVDQKDENLHPTLAHESSQQLKDLEKRKRLLALQTQAIAESLGRLAEFASKVVDGIGCGIFDILATFPEDSSQTLDSDSEPNDANPANGGVTIVVILNPEGR